MALQYPLHCGPMKLPLRCCLEVMLNWENLLLGSLGSSQFGSLIKYWKLQCKGRATAMEFVWLLWIQGSRRGGQKIEGWRERGSKETGRMRHRKRKHKKVRGWNRDWKAEKVRVRERQKKSRNRKDEKEREREEKEGGQHSEHECLTWH